jgi:twitching motility two-component system response regulator PilG
MPDDRTYGHGSPGAVAAQPQRKGGGWPDFNNKLKKAGRFFDSTGVGVVNDNERENYAGIKALAVDDSTTVRRLMDLTLTPVGVEVEFADNGEDALMLAQRRNYDIIFLDVMLPGIDGYQVCKAIKSDKTTKHTPVVMLTSKDSAFDRVRGIMAGTDVYLTKPLDRAALLGAMKKFLPQIAVAAAAGGAA